MNHPLVLDDFFHWIPPQDRPTRYGPPVPNRPVEQRRPLLWIARRDDAIYLVNDTGETLEWVSAAPGGFMTVDDEPVALSPNTDTLPEGCKTYHNVAPRAAVLLDAYHFIYDSDCMLTVSVRVKSPALGVLEFTPVPERGGLGETVLLWDTDDLQNPDGFKRLSE